MKASASAAIESVAVEIGGIPICLHSEDASFQAMVRERFAGFAKDFSDSATAALHFEIELLGVGELSGDEDVRVWKSGERWHARRGDFYAEWNAVNGSGVIRQELNPYALNSILRIVHTIFLAPMGGFLLHAASALRDGSAFVFSGVSGAGKTTIARLAPADAILLTDEISYVRRDGERYFAWGTPFAGEMGTPGANTSAPIGKLFFLEKGAVNQITAVERRDAVSLLLRNLLFFCDDTELVGQVFEAACDFVERVGAYRLMFVPDGSVWEEVASANPCLVKAAGPFD